MTKAKGGRQAVVGRFFRGLPVVDADEPLRIILNNADIKNARKLDPNNCAFAQACRRLFDSHAVLFLRRTAYVELPDSKGKRKVNRFIISPEMASRIAEFDKTGKCDEGGFILNPPNASKKLGLAAAYERKRRAAIASGDLKPKRRNKPNKKYAKAMLGVRDGRGKLGINYAF